LEETKLHELFKTKEKITLLDCFGSEKEKLKPWKEKCESNLKNFKEKVDKASEYYVKTKENKVLEVISLDEKQSQEVEISFKKLIKKMDLMTVLLCLKKDFDEIHAILQKPFDSQSIFSAYTEKQNAHKEYLDNLEPYQDELFKIEKWLKDHRSQNFNIINKRVMDISDFQNDLKKLKKRSEPLVSLIGHLEKRFHYLQFIHLFSGFYFFINSIDAYFLSLIEVSRRNHFSKQFSDKVLQLKEYLTSIRTNEISKRLL
jgi:hypothetical protein